MPDIFLLYLKYTVNTYKIELVDIDGKYHSHLLSIYLVSDKGRSILYALSHSILQGSYHFFIQTYCSSSLYF